MVRFEEEVFAVFAAVEGDPLHRALGEGDFLCGVASEVEPRDERMFEARAERRARAMEVAAGKIFFKRRGADDDAVDFHGGARRSAGDDEFFCGDTEREQKEKCANGKRAKAHGDDRDGVYYRSRYRNEKYEIERWDRQQVNCVILIAGNRGRKEREGGDILDRTDRWRNAGRGGILSLWPIRWCGRGGRRRRDQSQCPASFGWGDRAREKNNVRRVVGKARGSGEREPGSERSGHFVRSPRSPGQTWSMLAKRSLSNHLASATQPQG